MPLKRQSPDGSNHLFSCESCYRRKLKCSRGNPCTHCVRLKADCVPVESSNKRRKQRFPEAELLARIKRYEKALLSYGADLSNIKDEESTPEGDQPSKQVSVKEISIRTNLHQRSTSNILLGASEQGDMNHLLTILEGEETSNNGSRIEQVFYSRFFQDDGSSIFSATQTAEIPLHPAPFDIFKLWQTYSDNIQPICKILHAPTFQRKISSHGSQLHLAPAADQALFFGMYLAAIMSLSPEECETSFMINKEVLQKQYQHSAQVWLRRAGFWRTSDISVLQAFVLYLFTQQHIVDPRALASFTGMADRLARRIGLHRCKAPKGCTLVELEIRKRVWWELLHLDARTVERAGIGNKNDLKGGWSTSLLDSRSDVDLECQQNLAPDQSMQPSSEMIFALARSEAARCLDDIGNLQDSSHPQQGDKSSPLVKKLHLINSYQDEATRKYLCFCNDALPQHRLAILFTRMMFSRMRILEYLVEEASQGDSKQVSIRQSLLEHCNENLSDFIALRDDPAMQRFMWFLYQYMPAYIYIHLLRLLQVEVTGHLVDKTWQVLENFGSHSALPVDRLILRAWKARQAAAAEADMAIRMPEFVKVMHLTSENKDSNPTQASQEGSAWKSNSDLNSSQPDYMAILSELMAENTDFYFDWSI